MCTRVPARPDDGRAGRAACAPGRPAALPGVTEGEVEVSETVQHTGTAAAGPPEGQPQGDGGPSLLQRSGTVFIQQREATVFIVAVLLVIYFGFISSASPNFFTKLDIINITQIMAPIAIIAVGEVFLLICGEID